MLPAAWVVWITAGVFLFFGIKLLVTNEETSKTESTPSKHRVAITTFFMVTAAEWGDASQIGTAALVAHLHAPVQVVIGATLGLWAGSALAVGVGRVIGTRIPPTGCGAQPESCFARSPSSLC